MKHPKKARTVSRKILNPLVLLERGGMSPFGSWALSKGVFATHPCCRSFQLGISLNLVIVRIGLVYGPYVDFGLSRYPSVLVISAAYKA